MNVLSIDFDFFVPEKFEHDFGHQETNLFLGIMWTIRAQSFFMQGIDPRQEIKVQGDPLSLAGQLEEKGFRFRLNRSISVAESHASAYYDLKDEHDLTIYNIDAHHDLFYRQHDVVECGNWIGTLAKEGRVKKVVIVYPEWRKDEDLDKPGDEQIEQMRKWGAEVEIIYGLDALPKLKRTIHHVFIARSGAWVPPWTDQMFLSFVYTWAWRSDNGATVWGAKSLEGFLREEIDWEAAKAAGAQLRKAHDEMKKEATEKRELRG